LLQNFSVLDCSGEANRSWGVEVSDRVTRYTASQIDVNIDMVNLDIDMG
jgi:hypothetical protein